MQAIVVGPPIMITFTVKMLLQKGSSPEQIWVDHERRMACSVGKCGHCRMGEVYVCTDGPIFNYAVAQRFGMGEHRQALILISLKARAKTNMHTCQANGEAMISVRIPGGILPAHLLTRWRVTSPKHGRQDQIHLTSR